ncbi:MAG TPA: FecR domain-containing protein [Gammaproteobacteria bacterium]|nr:FecR domain-containing protein [Gammaproteobacteria bacterium]
MASSLTQYFALPYAFTAARTALPAVLALCVCAAMPLPAAHAEAACSAWQAELTAVEGDVELRRAGERSWQPGVSGAALCRGDSISVKPSSRALLTLPDHTTLGLDANTTLTVGEPNEAEGSLIELLRGVIHVISRDPRSLKITTPYANAGLEGTEFDIRVNEREPQTEVVVLEGQVAVTTPAGPLSVPSGQIAIARPGAAPTAEPLREPIELMRWTGHYPRIVDQPLPRPDAPPPPAADAGFFARRAAARLETSSLDAAAADLEAALRLTAEDPTALALQSIVARARSDHAAALRLARAATAPATANAASWLALSYAQESVADPKSATASAARAVELEPDNALALSRLAALASANGQVETSIGYATRAARLAPARAEPPTVLGFAYLSRLDSAAACDAFDRAIALEPSAPLPRLGRGLALIQAGDPIGGRRQLELAVALDPTNSLARSYVAKVYEAEHRAKLTGSQLALAKRLDPLDPTPWLLAGMQKLRANEPVEAFQDLRAATAKNGDRVAPQSRLPVDADLATRSASIARIDTALGFDRLALNGAWQAVTDRPSDYAGHRLLADAYSREPREEIARVSELFVAQLLQPANLTPTPVHLSQPSSFLATRLGPGPMAFNELSSPLASNGLQLQLSGATGGDGTEGTEATLAGLHDRVSYGIGQYRFASDGFRPNNDLDERAANAFVQFRPALDTSLQFELRSTRATHGDLALSFDPDLYVPQLRVHDRSDLIRFGARHDLTAHDTLLASVIHDRIATDAWTGSSFATTDAGSSSAVDLQLIHEAGPLRLLTGVAHTARDSASDTWFVPSPGAPPVVANSTDNLAQSDIYGYVFVDPLPTLTLTAGAAWNRIRSPLLSDQSLNPKLGVAWRPTSRTTVRAAAFRSVFSSVTTSRENPQPRLEPVQIDGFSQLLFGGTADRSNVRGVGMDHSLSRTLSAGWEASRRDTVRGLVNVLAPPDLQVETITLRERAHEAYVYWTPRPRLALSARYEHTNNTGPPLAGYPLFNYTQLTIERLPIEVRYFSPSGLVLGFRTSHISDSGMFVMTTPAGRGLEPGADRFWLTDAFVGYRLPNRRGLLSLNANNLLDRRFRFQDVDPENTSLIPERVISFRFTLAFD